MRNEAVMYWNTIASGSDGEARDAVLAGFRTEKRFDDAGREDARHLILPFLSSDDVVLDVGCGLGRLLKWAAPACRQAIGLDVSSEMLKRAKVRLKTLPNVRLKRLPLSLRFPVPDRSVDFAYFYHVSEHLEREDCFRILSEIRRCLRRSGSALVQFSLIDHVDNQREFLKWAREGDAEGVRSRFYSESEALVMLQMVKVYPQIRLYIPGEFAVIVTKQDGREIGNMPLVSLPIRGRSGDSA
jgi:ubiquinone/menaquinone biosynthesis C-methylase UbiE